MCNSTQGKSNIELKEADYQRKLYQRLASKLVQNEMVFFSQLERHYRKGLMSPSKSPLFSRLFVIKNIGDEFWFSIEPDEDNPYDVANILSSLYIAAASFRYDDLIVDEEELTMEEELDWRKDSDFIRVPITFKIYADLIYSFIDYSETRFETFNKFFHTMLYPDDKRTESEVKALKALLFNQMNVFASESVTNKPEKLRGFVRTDLFGFQVDHFFRFSKFASTGVFSIGDRLFQAANPHFLKQNNEPNIVSFQTGRPGALGQFAVLTFSQQQQGKGVSSPYSIYYLIERHAINQIRHQNNQLKDTNIRNTYLLLRRLGALRDIKRKRD